MRPIAGKPAPTGTRNPFVGAGLPANRPFPVFRSSSWPLQCPSTKAQVQASSSASSMPSGSTAGRPRR
ncbi:hypothetical protein E3U47_04405 [Pseudomonas sp. RIT623]|nr:hypothetical protein E3U47_04405 [Pseudomonas sp. RIT623]